MKINGFSSKFPKNICLELHLQILRRAMCLWMWHHCWGTQCAMNPKNMEILRKENSLGACEIFLASQGL